jgi:multidrug efflux pump subunit AcrA (membrane-fusion protein)
MIETIKSWWRSLRRHARGEVVEILPPLRPSRARPDARAPNYRRAAAVYAALATAPPDATYDQLIARVKQVTGQACSRKIVARWKQEHVPAASSSPAMLTVTSAAVLLTSLLIVAACRQPGAPPFATPTPAPIIISAAPEMHAGSGGQPRTLIIKLQITRPDDLHVKEGQHVSAGEILVDRRIARAPLEAQREQVRINLALMWKPHRLDTPQPPPAFFADAETAVVRAQRAADEAARKLDNVKARLVQMARLAELPAALAEHEEATRATLEREASLAEAELQLARAQLAQAKAIREHTERQNQLTIAAQRYREDEAIALAALLRAQFTAQLASLDRQIALLGEVRAPFSGTIKRLLWEEQTNNDITVTLHLALDADRRDGQRPGAAR